MKNKKLQIFLSIAVTLLPVLVGFVLWDRLPQQMPIHWNAMGEVDGYCSRFFAVVGFPLLFVALNVILMLSVRFDKKNRERNHKIRMLTIWLVPVMSLFVNTLTYATALGFKFSIIGWSIVFLGALFAVFGNYMPKCAQNSTIGIRIAWTLDDEENWNATHRFAGRIWLCGGIAVMFTAFLPQPAGLLIAFGMIFVMTIIPIIYSYRFYKRKEGKK